MKQILIIGGNGFLGRHLSPELKKLGYKIESPSSKAFNLLNRFKSDPYISLRFDEIWHLAAWTQAGIFCDTHRGEQWIVNQAINTHVLDYWKSYQPQAKLIAMGTSASYATEDDLRESVYLEGKPNDKFLAYAMCKRMLLIGLQCLNRQYGMDYLYLIPSTLYGPNYHLDGRQLHFIYDLIRKILNAQKGGDPVVLWGDGNQSRELVYVDDFVETALALNDCSSNTCFNIGAGHEITIREFAKSICEVVGYDWHSIRYDSSKYVGAKSKCLNISKLNHFLPDRGMTHLRDGLRETIHWVEAHLEQLNAVAN